MFGNLGTASLAAALTCLMIFGIPGGGKIKPLGWWTTVIRRHARGQLLQSRRRHLHRRPRRRGDRHRFAGSIVKGIAMPALALCLAIFLLFKKLTTKQVGVTALLFFYVASSAGGIWSYLADAIENARVGLQ
jgi:hypothetical protein